MYGFGVYNGGLKKVIKTLQLDKNRKLKFEEQFTNIIYGRTNTISLSPPIWWVRVLFILVDPPFSSGLSWWRSEDTCELHHDE